MSTRYAAPHYVILSIPPCLLFVLCPIGSLGTAFLYILSLCSSQRVKNQVSRPYKTWDGTIILSILIFRFLMEHRTQNALKPVWMQTKRDHKYLLTVIIFKAYVVFEFCHESIFTFHFESLRISMQRVLFKFCYFGENLSIPLFPGCELERSWVRWEGRDPRGLRHRIIPMTSVVRPRETTKRIAL